MTLSRKFVWIGLRLYRIKQVEELQQKLQWMEKQLNRAAERQVSVPDSDSRNDRPVLETPSSSQSQSGIAYLDEVVSGDDLISYSPAMSAESPEVSSANNSSHESNRIPSVFFVRANTLQLLPHQFLITK